MSLLYNLLNNGFGKKEDLNCSEKIIYGANIVYKLGLTDESLKLSAGFGGGMGIESSCGALTAGIMVLSKLFVKEIAHESSLIKDKTSEYLHSFIKEMSTINCYDLKKMYRTDEMKCSIVILKSAEILDRIFTEKES